MGEALLTGIVVLMIGAMGLFIFSNSQTPSDTPHSDIDCWINTSNDTLYIRHCGGDYIDVGDLDIIVTINGDKRTDTSENISTALGGKNSWKMGDIIEIDTSGIWGIQVNKGDSVEVYIVNKVSKNIIQKISLSPIP